MSLVPFNFKVSLVLFSVFFFLTCTAKNINLDFAAIQGKWQGEFMPGNDFLLVLSFDTTQTEVGRIKLFQSKIEIQDDPLSKIKFDEKKISFYIEAKDTPFKGVIDDNSQTITGNFYFPDGSVHALSVKKIDSAVTGNIEDKDSGDNSYVEILNKEYDANFLKEDLRYLVLNMKKYQPQLNIYISNEDFNGAIDRIENTIKPKMREDEFYRLLAPFVAKIGCSHTGIRLSQQGWKFSSHRF